MKKHTLLAIIAATLLAGCSCLFPGHERAPDSTKPRVFVVNGKQVVVSPEPLTFTPSQGKVEITWRLPKEASYTFAENGIVIDGRLVPQSPGEIESDKKRLGKDALIYVLEKQDEIINCRRAENDPKQFSCTNLNSRRAAYKYTIRVLDGAKPLVPLDPWIIN